MKLIHINLFYFLIILSNNSFGEIISRMGCEWVISERLAKNSENLWASQQAEDELLSYLHFEDDFFNPEQIQISFEQSNLQRKIYSSVVENGYEVIAYREYLTTNENISFPSVVVIKKQAGKGVFYIDNLHNKEIVNMTKNCLPNLTLN